MTSKLASEPELATMVTDEATVVLMRRRVVLDAL
jgi:hypothetical protein